MPKKLKIIFPDGCNGCEVCVTETQRQLKKAGLEGSLIRIFRENGSYSINLDPQINRLDLEKIKEVCPQANFVIVEEDSDYELLS